jgi:large subunit ribosomal protein L9
MVFFKSGMGCRMSFGHISATGRWLRSWVAAIFLPASEKDFIAIFDRAGDACTFAPLSPESPQFMANVQVILKERIKGLGAEADVVHVKRGFARNFLVPQGKAFDATAGNLRHLNHLKAVRAERESKELQEAEKIAAKLKKLKLKLTLQTGQGGKAFGSVTTMDIAKAVAESAGNIEIDRHQIQLDKPIKNTGTFEVPVKLHNDVSCFLKVTVTASEGDAGSDESADSSED